MKLKKLILIAILVIVAAGIAGYVVYKSPAKWKVDTSQLTQAFTSANADVKADIDKAVAAIKGGNYAEALTCFGKAADSGKLSDAEKQAVTDAVVELQSVIQQKKPADAEALMETIGELLNSKLI